MAGLLLLLFRVQFLDEFAPRYGKIIAMTRT